MKKRYFKFMTALAITLLLSTGIITTHAAAASTSSTSNSITQMQNKHKKGCTNPIYSILENKLGYSKAQIESAAKSGKTAFDLAKEKGKTQEDVRNMLFEAQSKHIDQKVSEGKLTKEEAATIKANMKVKVQKWNGSLIPMHRDKGFSPNIYSVLEKQLGFTRAQISNAANSGKSAFDLAKEKGKTPDQLKSMIVDAQSKELDQMVKEGKMPKEKADAIKAKIKADIQKWNGSLNYRKDKHNVN
jgi:predicted transcriptional regulator